MLSTLARLRALVRRRGVVPLTGRGSVVDAIAGEHVKGGWWSHPRGKIIFRLVSSLEDEDGVLCVKLVEGKVSFVDRALWPALVRVATDDDRRARAMAALSADARALSREVERLGELRIDRAASTKGKSAKTVRTARESLEKLLLFVADQLHTETGKHVARLRTWGRALPADVHRAAHALDFDDARRAIDRACERRD